MFLIPIGYGYIMAFLFSIPFGSICHARTFIFRQTTVVWFGMVLTHVYKDSLTLTFLGTRYQHLTNFTILISMGRFLDTTIVVETIHSPIYQINTNIYHN